MDDVLEMWPEQPADLDIHVGSPAPTRFWTDRRLFLMKATVLLITTLALIPILILQNTFGAALYVGFLVIVHVAGLVVFAAGLTRQHFGSDLRGLSIRIGGLAILFGLLYLASKGLTSGFDSLVFWVSLIAIWALHTAGAAMLHLVPHRQSGSFCPFV